MQDTGDVRVTTNQILWGLYFDLACLTMKEGADRAENLQAELDLRTLHLLPTDHMATQSTASAIIQTNLQALHVLPTAPTREPSTHRPPS
jgi:hypothetical protein